VLVELKKQSVLETGRCYAQGEAACAREELY
jgi:hypothetical protein